MTTPSPTPAPSATSWTDKGFCSEYPEHENCVLWGVPYQFLIIAATVIVLGIFGRYVIYVVFALLQFIVSSNAEASAWASAIFRSSQTIYWTTTFFRCGMLWLAYAMLGLPKDWTDVLDYIIPLPFIVVMFLFTNAIIDVTAATARDRFSPRADETDPGVIRVARTHVTAWSEGLRVVKYVAIVALVFVALAIEGVNIVSFLSNAALIGLILVFALQPWLRNLVGGLVVFADDKFVLGDSIRVAGIEGVVQRMTLRSTTILRPDNSLCIVPNARMMELPVANASMQRRRLVEVRVALDRDSDPDAVRDLIRKIDADISNLHPNIVADMPNSEFIPDDDKYLPVVQLDGYMELLVTAYLRPSKLGTHETNASAAALRSEIVLLIAQEMERCKIKRADHDVPGGGGAARRKQRVGPDKERDAQEALNDPLNQRGEDGGFENRARPYVNDEDNDATVMAMTYMLI